MKFELIEQGEATMSNQTITTVLSGVAFAPSTWPHFLARIADDTPMEISHYDSDAEENITNIFTWSWVETTDGRFDFRLRLNTDGPPVDVTWIVLRMSA